VRAIGSGELCSSSLGDGVCVGGGGSPVNVRWWGKPQWERRNSAILPGRLARCGRQHKGVAVAKTVAIVWSGFGWGKPLGATPYTGKLVPTTRKRCRLQSYMIFVLIQSGFSWRSQGTEGFPSRQRCELSSVWVIMRMMESWSGRPRLHAGHWAVRWAAQREKGGSRLGPLSRFRPMANRKMRKCFLFSNVFYISNQFKFK
jgi:hypothetical protein